MDICQHLIEKLLECVHAHWEVALRFKEWEKEVRCRGIFCLTREVGACYHTINNSVKC